MGFKNDTGVYILMQIKKIQMVSEHKNSSVSAFCYLFGHAVLAPQREEENSL